MEQRIFIVKSHYETKSLLRTLFSERLPPNKTTIRKNVKKCERDGTSLNTNEGRSGRIISTRTKENIEAVRETLERNQGRISARKNGLGISPSLFCQILKKELPWYPYKMI